MMLDARDIRFRYGQFTVVRSDNRYSNVVRGFRSLVAPWSVKFADKSASRT